MEQEEGQGESSGGVWGEGRRTGCRHDTRENREASMEELLLLSLRRMNARSTGTTGFDATYSSFEQYIVQCQSEIIEDTSTRLQVALSSPENMHWHQINAIEEFSEKQYLLNIVHYPDCHDDKICPTIRRGDVLLLGVQADMLPNSSESEDISLAIATEDECERFRGAFNIQLVRERNMLVSYNIVASLEINVQDVIEGWLSGHATVDNRDSCIINTILKIPDQITERCACGSALPDVSELINDLDENQMQIIGDISLSLSCFHSNHIELIKGAPGPVRTKVLSSLLVILRDKLNFVVYASSPKDIVGLLDGIHDLGLTENELKLFCEKAICFERKSDMEVYSDMSLESHMETTKKFFGKPGWRYFINLTVQMLEHFTGDKFKTEFTQVTNQLKDCISYLKSKLPKFDWDSDDMKGLTKNMEEINQLICRPDTYDISDDLDKKKARCAKMLKQLKAKLVSLVLPIFNSQDQVKDFCIENSRVMFCSVNSAFHLNTINQQIDCLMIDRADRVNESDMLVLLCLPSLRSIVLTGENQLQKQQQDQLCATLFGRLSQLGFKEHLLSLHHQPQRFSGQLGRSRRWNLGRLATSQPNVLKTEFTWIGRPWNKKYILAPVRDQGAEDTCSLHSTMATTESLYKLYHASQHPPQNFTFILDLQDMKAKYFIETGYEFGKELRKGWPRVTAALNSLINQGVIGNDDFANLEKVKQIKISSFENIDPTDGDQICEYLRSGKILVGAIRMSYNYFELGPGEVYHYDPNRPILNANQKPMSHAVMFVGYGGSELLVKEAIDLAKKQMLQNCLHLTYQNSYGKFFGFGGGFGRVGLPSVKNLALVVI